MRTLEKIFRIKSSQPIDAKAMSGPVSTTISSAILKFAPQLVLVLLGDGDAEASCG